MNLYKEMQTSRRDFLKTASAASALLATRGGFYGKGYSNLNEAQKGQSAIIAGNVGPNPKYRVLWTWDYGVFWDDSLYWQGKGSTGENQRRSH